MVQKLCQVIDTNQDISYITLIDTEPSSTVSSSDWARPSHNTSVRGVKLYSVVDAQNLQGACDTHVLSTNQAIYVSALRLIMRSYEQDIEAFNISIVSHHYLTSAC